MFRSSTVTLFPDHQPSFSPYRTNSPRNRRRFFGPIFFNLLDILFLQAATRRRPRATVPSGTATVGSGWAERPASSTHRQLGALRNGGCRRTATTHLGQAA